MPKLSEEENPVDKTGAVAPLAIEVSQLSFRYPKAASNSIDIPNWRVPRGQRIFLQGASGSGKSTLLKLLCGLNAGGGQLSILGTNLCTLSQAKRDAFRARHIGMVFQQFNLIPYLSILDNVLLASSLAGNGRALQAAKLLLESVGLGQLLWDKKAEELSIGQRQRVAIARAMINRPELLLFDEPTSALDEANQTLFMDTLQAYLDDHPSTTTVFVSHDMRLAPYFDHSIKLQDLSRPGMDGDQC